MNTATPQPGAFPSPAQGNAADPSMEDILASIRRILSEDEAEQPHADQPVPEQVHQEPLTLDSSMLVEEPAPPPMVPVHVEPPAPPVYQPVAAAPPPPPPPPPPPAPAAEAPTASTALLGPEATAAAASSVGSLLRTLVAERQQVAVHRGGPTIEDLVREEIRPVLKEWLDANLPPLVERLVRAEIERVVGRAIS
jgi:cell pole-organizing protein PopZ